MPERRSCSPSEPTSHSPSPSPEQLAGALRSPEAYPHQPGAVDFHQTQMSLLFLADDLVYKVKKPVNLGYLDYSSFEARRQYCEHEVELNRRLCPSAYLGVVPVTRESDGRLRVEGEGQTVEHAVKMRRLPQQRMLDHLLQQNGVTLAMMEAIASRLTSFHREAATSPEIAAFGAVEAIRFNTDENFEQTLPNIGTTVRRSDHSLLREYTNAFLKTQAALLSRRVEDGRIRDCHGDLHAAHVCMTEDICIYDCIEFNDRFRYGDVASEVAFLAMDLDRYRRRDLSDAFADAYARISGDGDIPALMPFYKCYRAVVRGKVEGFKLGDPMIPEEDRERAKWLARTYFELARSYATGRGHLVIMCGLTGSGKSTVAEGLGRLLAGTVISSDVVRKQLAGMSADTHQYESYGEGIYSPEWTRHTYDEMLRQAKPVLTSAGHAILDASFLKSRERTLAVQAARQAGARAVLVECDAPHAVLMRRLRDRTADATISDGRPEILEAQVSGREDVVEFAEGDHISIDATQNSETILEDLWTRL